MTKQAAATIQERINTNSPFVNKAHAPTSVFLLFQIKKNAGKLALKEKSSYFCNR